MPEFVHEQLPARIVFGAGAARTELAAEVERLGARRLLLVASTRDADRVGALVAPFAERVAARFSEVSEHVPAATAAAARAAATGCDGVLAIGGGSTLGAAKAVAAGTGLPVLAVPSTYSGSEMTPIWGVTEHGRKVTRTDPAVLPRAVVYDPELAATLPRDIAVASAFNALAHCVEAFWAPRRNPVCSAAAEDGVRVLAAGLRATAGLAAATELLRGAYLGGTALAAGTGLHHKLCHVLGGVGMPHARTHAVVLPHVLAFTAPGAPDAAARVARALDVADAAAGLRALADDAGVPRGLRALGLREEQLDEVAALTEPGVPADHPVPVGGGALRRLLQRAWEG